MATWTHEHMNDRSVKPRVLYISDPLCGWCYAFGYGLKEAMARMGDKLDFTVLLGGMVVDDREGPIGRKSEYILQAIPRLERITGVLMGEAHKRVLAEGTQWQSSVLPSKAVVAVRELKAEVAIEFLHQVQVAHFQEGADLNDPSLYAPIAVRCGVDEDLFNAFMADERLTTMTRDEFRMVEQWGISGYPSLAAEVGRRFYGLAHGYRNTEELEKLFEAVLRVDPTTA